MIRLPHFSDNVPVALLAAGEYPAGAVTSHILKSAEKVVCCDGAAAGYVSKEGLPFAVVGDCDSLPDSLRASFPDIVHCDPDQETNDLTKAVKFCVSQGLANITILGAAGLREDHTLANISLMAEYVMMPGVESVRMVTESMVLDAVVPAVAEGYFEACSRYEKECLFPVLEPQRFVFESIPGQQISLFTPIPGVRITTCGLVYPLDGARLKGWWHGTLNESAADNFAVTATGPAIVCRVF